MEILEADVLDCVVIGASSMAIYRKTTGIPEAYFLIRVVMSDVRLERARAARASALERVVRPPHA
jgi:hypothetical protein